MGMFSEKRYLTGSGEKPGFTVPGEAFWLHDAKLVGMVTTPNGAKLEAKLLVSRTGNAGEAEAVFTTGAAITGQIERMSPDDRGNFPTKVKIDLLDTGKGNPANVLVPADDDSPAETGGVDF
jgi:hypothetical protein